MGDAQGMAKRVSGAPKDSSVWCGMQCANEGWACEGSVNDLLAITTEGIEGLVGAEASAGNKHLDEARTSAPFVAR